MTMLSTLVSFIDGRLRARHEIFDFSDSPHCIFRIQVVAASCDLVLSDGTRLAAGSRLIKLHLLNEHIRPFPSRGPTLGWARGMCRDLETSLEELAAFVANNPALDEVTAIGGKMMFGSTERTELVAHFAERYGFAHVIDSAPSHSVAQWLHLMGENILISMIVMVQNPAAFRADLFRRERVPVYLHRAELMRRFGARRKICQCIN
jgi:hypothetical protein